MMFIMTFPRFLKGLCLPLFAATLLSAVGCQPAQRIFYRPGSARVVHGDETVMLAAYQAQPGSSPTTSTAPAEEAPAPQESTTRPARRRAFTSPGIAFQRMSVAAAALGFVSSPETLGAGKEISESVMLSSEGVIGRAGLTAPPPMFANAIVSRPGLQEGLVTGLAFGSRTNNIFRPTVNRLSGPGGRCQDLVRAGFFGGSQAACETCLRRK